MSLKELFTGVAEWRFQLGHIIGPTYALEKFEELISTGRFSVNYLGANKAEELARICFSYGLNVQVVNSGISRDCKDVSVSLVTSEAK